MIKSMTDDQEVIGGIGGKNGTALRHGVQPSHFPTFKNNWHLNNKFQLTSKQ